LAARRLSLARQRDNGVLPRLPIPEQQHLCFQICTHTHKSPPPSSIGRAHATRPRGRAEARLAQSVERKALNLVVVGSSPTVGVFVDGNSSCDSHHLSVARWRGAALQNDTCHPSVLPCAVDLMQPTPGYSVPVTPCILNPATFEIMPHTWTVSGGGVALVKRHPCGRGNDTTSDA
jgi:hypothetical protein